MKGCVLAHRHLTRRHAFGKRLALLVGHRHHRRFQGGIERVLRAIADPDEGRQPAQLEEFTHQSRFLLKVRQFLTQHQDHISIRKLRRNEQLTPPQDLAELERMFQDEGIASVEDLDRVRADGRLGLFIRSLVGLDREAAKQALAAFMDGRTLTANQIEFVNLVIDHLTERGVMDPRRLYESPFTDLGDQGVSGVFSLDDAKVLVQALAEIQRRAAA